MDKATYWIKKLDLQKHPEGGWFKETYRSEEIIDHKSLPERYNSNRNFSTAIFYLLIKTDYSTFHKIKSDELWHFYDGTSPVEIVLLCEEGIKNLVVGRDIEKGENFQVIIPKNVWFAAHLINKNGYALVGCTVSPGFDFDDFKMADIKELKKEFPYLAVDIDNFLKVNKSVKD